MPQRTLAAIQQRAREVIEGTLAVFVSTAVAFQVKPRRAPAFGPARHWRFAGGAFTPPLTKGMLTPPWNPSIRFPALTGGA